MQRISVDLPEPGRPADHDALALVDGQVDVAQDVELPVPLVHADDLDRRLVGDLEPGRIDVPELRGVDGMRFGHGGVLPSGDRCGACARGTCEYCDMP